MSSSNNLKQYKTILNNINDLVFNLNDQFKIEYINKNVLYEKLGYNKNQLLGNSLINYIDEENKEQVINQLKNRFKPENKRKTIKIKDINNKWISFEYTGKSYYDNMGKMRYFLVLQDITKRRIAEERYKTLFENSPNAILILNFKGIVIDANITTQRLLGFNKKDIINRSIFKLKELFPIEIKPFYKNIFKASFKGKFPKPVELKIRTKNKDNIWVNIQASLVKAGENILIQFIFQDITEKKKVEILEKRFKEKLEQEVENRTKRLNKLLNEQKLYLDQILKSSQFKTEFMATMSHELRTPLNAIIGFTDLLLEGAYGKLNEKQLEFIKDIKSSAHHQFDMIKQILDISKIEAGKTILNYQKCSLNTIITQILSSLKPLYRKKNLKIKFKGVENEKLIFVDPIRLKQILYNLLNNAIKFTMEGTIILIIKEKHDQWIFKVKDTGIGIAREDFDLVFKEFKRIDSTYVRSTNGTGLGLPLTKRLVELFGGEIKFESILGVGTTFIFTILKREIKEIDL